MEILMAIGLDYTGDQELQNNDPASVKDILKDLDLLTPIEEIEKSKGLLTFKSYDEAEQLIKNLYAHAPKINKSLPKEKVLFFYAVLMNNDPEVKYATAIAINMLNGTIAETQEPLHNYPVQIYITENVYKELNTQFQDKYHSAVEVAGKVLHQRFSQDAQRCFIISPIGEEGSDVRKRADYVFETYIKPACEGTPLRPVRGEMMHGALVVPELMEALQSDPMVIAYLGHSPLKYGWNPNVMMELGSRLGSNAPCVIIKDVTSGGQPYDLPFDLKDVRVIDIPEQEGEELEHGVVKIRTIRDAILAGGIDRNQWQCLYPVATVDMKVGGTKDSASKYTEASKDMETLFEIEAIAGREILPILENLLEKMPDCQRAPFLHEQRSLITGLIMTGLGAGKIHATVPIVFEKHNTYQGRAFLPVIVRYSFNQLTSTLKLTVIYMDVTAITQLNEDGYYVCNLVGNNSLALKNASTTSTQP